MFRAEPYLFEPTYPPGEVPALHGEGEERSASPEPIRIGNMDAGVFEGIFKSGSTTCKKYI